MARLSNFLRLILLAALAVSAPAMADDRVDEFLRGFDEMALWHDNRDPVPVRKWNRNLRVRMTGPMSSSYDNLIMENLNTMAGIAGLSVEQLPADARNENFLVQFDETSGYQVSGRGAGCMTRSTYTRSGEITRVVLSINLQFSDLRHCIVHEMLHGFGFPGHPHGLNTVLSYVYRGHKLSEIDEMSLRVLYDPRVKPGMFHLPALLAARQVIAERLGLVAAGGDVAALGHVHFKSALRYLTEEAEKGNDFVQTQLGNAYSAGQYVERDDKTATEWYWRAAESGNPMALNNLGELYRDGLGVERDPVMAFILLRVAERRGYKGAASTRQNLAASMTKEQISEAERRAAAWKPRP